MDGHHTSSHKLYNLEYVAALFAGAEKVTPRLKRDVEQAVKQTGTYIALGEVMYFTERDIQNLFENLRQRGAGKPEPLDTDTVMMVVIGHHLDVNAEVFVGWSWSGGVDDLHEQVVLGCPGVHVLEFKAVSYGAYKQHLKAIEAQRSIGRWYNRTPEMNAWLLSTFATGENDNDGEL